MPLTYAVEIEETGDGKRNVMVTGPGNVKFSVGRDLSPEQAESRRDLVKQGYRTAGHRIAGEETDEEEDG